MNGISEEKYTHIDEIKEQTKAVFDELMEQAKLEEGDILVVGCSSSEIASHRIGSYSSAEIGEAVAQTFLNCCKEKKIYLAAQCCEHLNRAITIRCRILFRRLIRTSIIGTQRMKKKSGKMI